MINLVGNWRQWNEHLEYVLEYIQCQCLYYKVSHTEWPTTYKITSQKVNFTSHF